MNNKVRFAQYVNETDFVDIKTSQEGDGWVSWMILSMLSVSRETEVAGAKADGA